VISCVVPDPKETKQINHRDCKNEFLFGVINNGYDNFINSNNSLPLRNNKPWAVKMMVDEITIKKRAK
jgi:hypothetical protein